MATLVHLSPAKLAPRIRRGGLPAGAFGFPVLPSYTLTHQWTRELAKWKRQPLVGVYFRLDDEAPVRFGRYDRPHAEAAVRQAIASIRAERDPRGWEIVLLAPAPPQAILRQRPVRAVTGWRHKPDAHGRAPCGCPACIARGEPGGRKLRARYERSES
jgi:hypothetical protein